MTSNTIRTTGTRMIPIACVEEGNIFFRGWGRGRGGGGRIRHRIEGGDSYYTYNEGKEGVGRFSDASGAGRKPFFGEDTDIFYYLCFLSCCLCYYIPRTMASEIVLSLV